VSIEYPDLDKDRLTGSVQLHDFMRCRNNKSMKAVTTEMHELAKKTRSDTVSMRIITMVTFFFLPGTFISVGSSHQKIEQTTS
jgi:hypothetical protein